MSRPLNLELLAECEESYLRGLPCRGSRYRRRQEELAAKHGVSCRTVRYYFGKVRERLAGAFRAEAPDAIRARAESMLLNAYRVARKERRGGEMAQIASRIAELHGAFAPGLNVKAQVSGIAELVASALGEPAPGAEPNDKPSK